MPHKHHGFTLLELSIVITVMGLIIGGLIMGQSLIRSSQLQSIVSDQDSYRKAVLSFRDKYRALPGDMANATSFWGTSSICGTSTTASGYSIPTCNGNGDGYITNGNNNTPMTIQSQTSEHLRAWQHLSNAELVNGKYTGAGASGSHIYSGGLNLPASRIGGGLYTLFHVGNVTDTTMFFKGVYNHVFVFGAVDSVRTTNTAISTFYPVITAGEALQLDQKIDDGRPDRGVVRAFNRSVSSGPVNCVSATPAYDTAQGAAFVCSLIFITGF